MQNLTTESRNPRSKDIDQLNALQIAQLMNEEDAQVASAVGRELGNIAIAIEWVADAFRNSGRLFYLGQAHQGGWECWMLQNVRQLLVRLHPW